MKTPFSNSSGVVETKPLLRVRFYKNIQDCILKSERLDFSVPLTHHDPTDLGLICFVFFRI